MFSARSCIPDLSIKYEGKGDTPAGDTVKQMKRELGHESIDWRPIDGNKCKGLGFR